MARDRQTPRNDRRWLAPLALLALLGSACGSGAAPAESPGAAPGAPSSQPPAPQPPAPQPPAPQPPAPQPTAPQPIASEDPAAPEPPPDPGPSPVTKPGTVTGVGKPGTGSGKPCSIKDDNGPLPGGNSTTVGCDPGEHCRCNYQAGYSCGGVCVK